MKLHHVVRLSTRPRGAAPLIGCVLTATLVLAGCGAPPRPNDVAVYASGTDLESGNPLVTVHPLSRQVQRYALFVTLARYDSALAPVPYAARSWSWSPDHRRLEFHLERALTWHDGVATTARDVAFTLAAARDPATGYPRASDLADVEAVLAPNDSTAVVVFRTPPPDFPLVFCELPLLPAHLLAQVPRADLRRAPFNLHPVGNGPFTFVERRAGERWVFARNPAFPVALGGPPRLAGLVIAVVDEPTTKFAGLASGDLDVAGIAPSMAPLAKRDPQLRVLEYPVLFTTGLVFNAHRPPFDDPRVRHAVSAAIDRGRIVRAALAGFGRPASGPVPPENPLALSSEAPVDTVLADALLDAAGWRRAPNGMRTRNGRVFSFDLLTVGSGDNAVEQLIQADLGARGIRVEIRQVEMGTFLSMARAPEKRFDALLTGVSGDVSLSYLVAMFASAQAGSALDYANFHTSTIDTLLARARRAASVEARLAAWAAVQRELARELPVAWLYHSRGVQGLSARLANVVMDLRGEMVSVAHWEIEPAIARTARR